nr:MAG TPA_asm: hypothetical protein [Caudoviricetes sp.]
MAGPCCPATAAPPNRPVLCSQMNPISLEPLH